MYEVIKSKKGYESCNVNGNYAYGTANLNIPSSGITQANLVNRPCNFSQVYNNQFNNKRRDAYLRGTTNPPQSQMHDYRMQDSPIPFSNAFNYVSNDFISFDSALPLNTVAANLSTSGHAPIPLNEYTHNGNQRYGERKRVEGRYKRTKKTLPKINPNRGINSPPHSDDFVGHFNHKLSPVPGFKKSNNPLRKRVRSTNSTESTESHSAKFVKTSEDHGSKRSKGNNSNFRSQRNHSRNASPPKISKRKSYNMIRLDLNLNIDSVRYQQELELRLKIA
eukprot:CAMPEP_0205828674 /NCGR_PEP_ID=MMETSP0206-20130828/35840_1 /ASSEMBLY_ACC=CAM_ASM_000279 /TAXON_ID=36767 /ORGANISM="Euplotes focardii, Strain TN1" /LENGTH=277 /DNA_ID=CAMNT_0053130719 /DNA_START=24 /DNA_END=853 /DNA_ORIENTATION=-